MSDEILNFAEKRVSDVTAVCVFQLIKYVNLPSAVSGPAPFYPAVCQRRGIESELCSVQIRVHVKFIRLTLKKD